MGARNKLNAAYLNGSLLVAALMLIILGYEALDSPVVVIVATVIPLSLALGLIWDRLPGLRQQRRPCLA